MADFGREFACSVASSMAEFIGRLDNPAMSWTIKRGDKILASVRKSGLCIGRETRLTMGYEVLEQRFTRCL